MAEALPDDVVEEILLRFPPHDPACLVSAALVCKPWCHLVSSPRFRRRFREFHRRTPPMLGVLCNHSDANGVDVCNYVSTYPPPRTRGRRHRRWPALDPRQRWRALDARHGRVLLSKRHSGRVSTALSLVVWDPATDVYRDLPDLQRQPGRWRWNAAVVCAGFAGTCDHLDCHRGGPFLVVFLGLYAEDMITCVYSSDTDAWSEPIITPCVLGILRYRPAALAQNALYFMFMSHIAVKYDLELHQSSVIQIPGGCFCGIITTAEDGALQTATISDSRLYTWSMMKTGDHAGRRWIQSRVIQLKTLPVASSYYSLVGFVDGMGVFLFRADDVLYKIDLKTCQVTKVCEASRVHTVIPYMTFYTPALRAACIGGVEGSTGEGPSSVGRS